MARKRTYVSPHKRILSFLSSCLSLSFLSFFSTLLHDACGGCRRGCCWLLAAGCCRCCRPTENWWLERKKNRPVVGSFKFRQRTRRRELPARDLPVSGGQCSSPRTMLAAAAAAAAGWLQLRPSCCCCQMNSGFHLISRSLSHFSLSFLSHSLSLFSFLRCCMMRAADGLGWR